MWINALDSVRKKIYILNMRSENPTQNKLIVLARKVWDQTKDADFSFRKIAKALHISEGTANEVHKIWKDKYDLGVAFRVEKNHK